MGIVNLALRGTALFFTVIVVAISGSLVHQTTKGGSPSQINFDLAAGVISFLSLIYFITIDLLDHEQWLILSVLDGVNALFTLAAGAALAAGLGVHSCSNPNYTKNNSITNGSDNFHKRCQEAQAATTFTFFLMFTYIVTLALSLRKLHKEGTGMRTNSFPSMSQV